MPSPVSVLPLVVTVQLLLLPPMALPQIQPTPYLISLLPPVIWLPLNFRFLDPGVPALLLMGQERCLVHPPYGLLSPQISRILQPRGRPSLGPLWSMSPSTHRWPRPWLSSLSFTPSPPILVARRPSHQLPLCPQTPAILELHFPLWACPISGAKPPSQSFHPCSPPMMWCPLSRTALSPRHTPKLTITGRRSAVPPPDPGGA